MRADFTLGALAARLGARAVNLQGLEHLACRAVSTDTRSIVAGDLFVALRGVRFDAHDYVGGAIGKGAVAAVVDHEVDPELPQLVVADTLQALGQLGAFNRECFAGPVFAVTGSSGKTSVKEMLAGMLAQRGETLATRGNLNNEIGVPLTLLRLDAEYRYAVVELGASAVGEIARTTRMTVPAVAVLTNALGAHLEGFGSLDNIVKAKGEIFEGLDEQGVGVVNRDDPHADVWLDKLRRLGRRALTFSIDSETADVTAVDLELTEKGSYAFTLVHGSEQVRVKLGVIGRHNVANAAAAAAAWVAAGLPLEDAKPGLEAFKAVPGRLCPHVLGGGALLIDDSYNASPGAVRAAIDALMSLPGPHTLVLGDMAELGEDAVALHADVGSYAAERKVDCLLTTGTLMRHAAVAAAAKGCEARHYPAFEDLVSELESLDRQTGVVLVKGSRSAGMDRAVKALLDGER